MKTLEKQIARLAARGVSVQIDEQNKTVTFAMDTRLIATAPDKKLYSIMQASAKVERALIAQGYRTIANGEIAPYITNKTEGIKP